MISEFGGYKINTALTSSPNQFYELVAIIEQAKARTLKAVNDETVL